MSDSERPKRAPESAGQETSGAPGPELVGGIVFLLGCVPAAAVAKAVKDGIDPTGPVRGTAKLAASLMNAWGTWPSLAASAGLALIGALILVGNLRREPLRHIAGVLVTALGLAALLAAFSPGAGGRLGAATGGALATGVGVWAGALLGALVIAAAVWLAWFQDRAAAAVVGALGVAGTAAEAVRERRARGQRRRKARRVESKPSLGEAISCQDVDGVSAAEASMLAPDDNTLRYMEEVWRRASEPIPQAVPLPPSPYPEDVRLHGLVPEGAQPIVEDDAAPAPAAPETPIPASPPVEAAGAAQWTPARRPAAAAAPLEDSDPFGLDAGDSLSDEDVAAVVDAVRREGAAVEEPRAYPEGVKPLGDPRTPIPSHAPDAPPLADQADVLPPAGVLPRPSWETAELFEGAADAVESTSIELDTIDRLLAGHEPETTEEGEAALSEEAEDVDEGEDEAAEYEEGEEDEDEEEEDEAAEYEEGEEDEDEDEEEEDEAAEYEEGEEGEDEEEEDEAAEYEEGEEDEDEEEEDEAAEYEEGEEDEDEEEEDEAAEYEEGEEDEDEEEEDEAAEDEDGEEEEDEEDEEDEEEGDEAAEDEEGEEDEDEEEEDEAAEDEDGEEEEDEDEEEEDEAAEDEDGEEEEDEDEEEEDEAAEYEEVEDEELEEPAEAQPAPAPAAAGPEDEAFDDGVEYEPLDVPAAGPERDHVLSPAPPPDEKALVLQRAGSLFVSEGRVAVSLLQRELGLAFEDACQVLDDLQNAGLIGPYRGGQKRDILLTAQEWEARCAGS